MLLFAVKISIHGLFGVQHEGRGTAKVVGQCTA